MRTAIRVRAASRSDVHRWIPQIIGFIIAFTCIYVDLRVITVLSGRWMGKSKDKSPVEAMDVSGDATAGPNNSNIDVSSVGATTTMSAMYASSSSDYELRMSRMEVNMDKMALLMSNHFGQYDEEPSEGFDAQESQECGPLPGCSQDGGHTQEGDAPQAGGSQQKSVVAQTSGLWAKIAKELKLEEELAPPLSQEVTDFLAKCLRKKPSQEAEKLMKEDKSFRQPSNCPELAVPVVEEAMWRKLDMTTKSKDLAWQNTQKTVLRGVTAVARAVDQLSALQDPTTDEVVLTLTHALQLLAATNVDLSFRRREQIKTVLDGEYKAGLCAASVPITDKLFGGNLTEQVKDITEANKLTNRVMAGGKVTRGRGTPSQSYGRGRGNNRQWQTPYWRGGQNRQGGRGRGNGRPNNQTFPVGRSGSYWDSVGQQSKNGQSQQTKKQTPKE
jgi:hypothetical protein